MKTIQYKMGEEIETFNIVVDGYLTMWIENERWSKFPIMKNETV